MTTGIQKEVFKPPRHQEALNRRDAENAEENEMKKINEIYDNFYFIITLGVLLIAMFLGLFVIQFNVALEIWDKLGIATFIGVGVAYYGIKKQIENSIMMRNKDLFLDASLYIKALAYEVENLCERVTNKNYINHFQSELRKSDAAVQNNEVYYIKSFSAQECYTSIYDNNTDKIAVLNHLTKDVVKFYLDVKGIMEDANNIYEGKYRNESISQSELASMMIDNLINMEKEGSRLVPLLKLISEEHKKYYISINEKLFSRYLS